MDVGKVSKVEPVGGDSPAVVVTMKLEDEALPIHKDARIKVRPRLFFEGNLFFDVQPGHARAPATSTTATRSRSRRPRRRCSSTRCSARSTTDTREDLQKLLVGYGDALNGKPQPGEDADQDPDTKGETGRQVAERLATSTPPHSLRGGAIVNDAMLGTELHDLSKLIGSQQKIFAALSSHEGSLKDLITNFNTTMGALASEEANLRATIHELPRVLEAAGPALDNLNAAFPSTRAWALEMIPGVRETPATIEAGLPVDPPDARARCRPPSCRASWTTSSRRCADFAEFTDGQIDFLPVLDDFNRCQLRRDPADAGAAHRRRRALHRPPELRGVLPGDGLAGRRVPELRRQRHVRAHPGRRRRTRSRRRSRRAQAAASLERESSSRSAPVRRRARSRPTSPSAKCHTQPVPDLSDAPIGGGP